MKYCLNIGILLMMCFNISSASIEFIREKGTFNILQVDSISIVDTSYVLDKLNSLRKADTTVRFISPAEFTFTYVICDLPCLKAYYVNCGKYCPSPFSTDPYEEFLFNICDSTIYPFGGSVQQFNNLIKSYLPKIINEGNDRIEELIEFYLNTLDVNDGYHIISSIYDYQKRWSVGKENEYYRQNYFTDEEMQNDIEEIAIIIKPVDITRDSNQNVVVKVITWEFLYGTIESWEFKITGEVFEIGKREIIGVNKGPYLWPINYR